MRNDIYCNCEAFCIHKCEKLHKLKEITFTSGRAIKTIKVQICNNQRQDCGCRYRSTIDKVFKY